MTAPEDEDEDMDSSDVPEWTPDDDPGGSSNSVDEANKHAVSGDSHDSQITRFISGGRRSEGRKRDEWNKLEEEWKQINENPFPRLPVNVNTWHKAVLEHSTIMMEWMQQVDSPKFILRTLNASTVLDWTRQFRVDCLMLGLSELQEKIIHRKASGMDVDNESVKALEPWVNFIGDQRNLMTDDRYLHSQELWGILNKLKTDKVELLQLCRIGKADRLARQVVAAIVYAPEFGRLQGKPGYFPSTTEEYLKRFIEVLQKYPSVQKAYYAGNANGDWAALESLLALQKEKEGAARMEKKD